MQLMRTDRPRMAAEEKPRLNLRNLPTTVSVFAVMSAFELYSAASILQQAPAVIPMWPGFELRLGLVEIGISFGCGVLAMIGAAAAADMKNDTRPEQRRRSGQASALAFMMMLIPAHYLGNGFAYQVQHARWQSYTGSAEEQQILERVRLDPFDREARAELRRSNEPRTVEVDDVWLGAHFFAFLLYGLLWRAAAVFRVARPETPREQSVRLYYEDKRRREAEERRLLRHSSKEPFSLMSWLRLQPAEA